MLCGEKGWRRPWVGVSMACREGELQVWDCRRGVEGGYVNTRGCCPEMKQNHPVSLCH